MSALVAETLNLDHVSNTMSAKKNVLHHSTASQILARCLKISKMENKVMDAMIVFSSQIPSRGIINCRSGFYHLQTHGSISLMVPEATRYINTSQYVLYYLNAQHHATFFHLSSQLLFSLSFFGYVFFFHSPHFVFLFPRWAPLFHVSSCFWQRADI